MATTVPKSLMAIALMRGNDPRPQRPDTAMTGPATRGMPIGVAGAGLGGLDDFALKRQAARDKFAQLQAGQAALMRRHGPDAFAAALQTAKVELEQSEAAYVKAAAAHGLGMFTE